MIKTKIAVMEEYHASGEDILGYTVWVLRDWPPISKDEDSIPQYVRARLTVLTLLLRKIRAIKLHKWKWISLIRS